MSNRYQTYPVFTTASVGAGATLQLNEGSLPSSFNQENLLVVMNGAAGATPTFSFRVYKSSTFASNKRLDRWESQATPLLYPIDRTSGTPAAALEGTPLPYDDDDGVGQWHIEIVNNDTVGHTFTVTLEYEEVGVMSASGDLTLRGTLNVGSVITVANGGTGRGTFTANGVIYGNGTGGLLVTAQGAAGTVLHGNGGVPTFTAVSLTADVTGSLPLANGGTNATLAASNGGIFYSTASAGAILAATATANQMLLSGAFGAPAWSTVTHPATTTINQLLYSSSANVLAGLATGNLGVVVTSATGVPSVAAMTAGSVLFTSAMAGAAQDNSNFFWDATNHRLGIGTASPQVRLDVEITGAANLEVARFLQSDSTSGNQTYLLIGKGASTGRSGGLMFVDNTDTVSGSIGFFVYGDAYGTGIVQKKGGTVGIGGTPTTGQLDVFGSGQVAANFRVTTAGAVGGLIQLYDSTNAVVRGYLGYGSGIFGGGGITDFGLTSVGNLKFSTNAGPIALTIDTSQKTTFAAVTAHTGVALFSDGAAGAPSVSSITYPTTGMYFSAGPAINWAIAGTRNLSFDGVTLVMLSNSAVLSMGTGLDVNLVRDAANVLALKNSTTAQEFRVYGTNVDGAHYVRLFHSGTNDGYVGNVGDQSFNLMVNNTAQWQVRNGAHAFTPIADNSLDFGTTSTRIASGYFGTSVNVGIATNATGLIYGAVNSGRANVVLDSILSSDASTLMFRGANGTQAALTNVTNGQTYGQIATSGYSNGYLAMAQIGFVVDGTFTAGQRPPSRIEFYSNQANFAQTLGMKLDGSQLLTLYNTTLLATGVALTNGAGAQIATMTNGPAAGNPTKWIPINDNGTTRYIPCW